MEAPVETICISQRKGCEDVLLTLKKYGWGSGFRSPFANAESKALEDKVIVILHNIHIYLM